MAAGSASLPTTRLQREAELRHHRRRQQSRGGGGREGAGHEGDCKDQLTCGLTKTDSDRVS